MPGMDDTPCTNPLESKWAKWVSTSVERVPSLEGYNHWPGFLLIIQTKTRIGYDILELAP